MKKQKTDKGFSLIELIIVIAIMAVLVVVCAPMYIKYIHNAGVARDWANLRLYYDEIQADYASTGEYNPNVTGYIIKERGHPEKHRQERRLRHRRTESGESGRR